MTKLEKLIAELCPNGVEYRPMGEVATIVRGASPRPIKKFLTVAEDGICWIKIGDVDIGSKYITSTAEKITQDGAKKSRLVKKGDFILSNSMSFGRPYILKIDGCIHDGWLSISNFEKELIPDFLYYVLVSTEIQNEMAKKASFGGAVQNLNADIVKTIKIPLPPIEVQREIVRILDNFTELTAELEAELTARKKQYEYYRDMLLNFDVRGGGITDCKWRALGEVCVLKAGKSISSDLISDEKNEQIPYPCIGGNGIRGYVSKFNRSGEYPIIGRQGALCGCVNYINGSFYATEHAVIVDGGNNYLQRFLYHYLTSMNLNQYKSAGAQPGLSVAKLNTLKVPVPSLSEQNRIVSILDRFDKLCNDITEGLPAEIEARQKQYEYYRDKLLAFKMKE